MAQHQQQQPQHERIDSYHSVVVVGAGLAGLHAARLLRAKGFEDVLVVEAQAHVGGRVRQLHGFTGWPIEVGPEFVHGSRSRFTDVARELGGLTFTEKPWPDRWYFGRQRLLTGNDGAPAEVEALHELFEGVGDEPPPPPGADVTAEDWLKAKGATPLQLAVADACYANDFGCSLRQLGLRELIVENQRWDSGETYLVMDQPMSALIDKLRVGLDIRTSWPVTRVTYGAGGAVLHGPAGARLGARAAVVTAPLAVLQQGRIAFEPPLPASKQGALRRLRMGNAVKVVAAFSRRFWPDDLYDVVCPDCFVPEFWMTRHTVTDGAAAHLHAAVGFVAGERADALRALGPQEAVRRFLAQLDEIFGSGSSGGSSGAGDSSSSSGSSGGSSAASATPATSAYVKAHVFDWAQEPWVGGAYSFPSHGAADGDRDALAAPVANVLFFAGEATHPAVNPCMQAALETGERAAAQVEAALSAPASRL